ncbi:hypothetical protein EJ05DRAFT_368053 [Pseudovirgaria hyperparasitica]|uniref:Uncharacterized protein n=1 Tax=Pseudovirgaria hyperparasitica TaxID=470096 RepID=A0A6A6W6K5_9PEZI|nr:uncharacterized protein EJ05DRAFT_368053 [Pseudovirgaria hyperparasitica]KAF2757829.1 hypothetical protein EJ05DRAFT_368053 [Pseudovirgaria hyperparasitica]
MINTTARLDAPCLTITGLLLAVVTQTVGVRRGSHPHHPQHATPSQSSIIQIDGRRHFSLDRHRCSGSLVFETDIAMHPVTSKRPATYI